uniref:Uncharacterized protein n=1 Tax=Rhizophora mucronata TaxID=61149 RepID=A0A2P2PHC9_RHIMU
MKMQSCLLFNSLLLGSFPSLSSFAPYFHVPLFLFLFLLN